jgi:hypothetical protein
MDFLYPIAEAEQFRVPTHTRLVLKRRDGEAGCWLQVTLVRRSQALVTVNLVNHNKEGRTFLIDLDAGCVKLDCGAQPGNSVFQHLMTTIATARQVLEEYEQRYG